MLIDFLEFLAHVLRVRKLGKQTCQLALRLSVVPFGNQLVSLPQTFLQPEILLPRLPVLPNFRQELGRLGMVLVHRKDLFEFLLRPGQISLLQGLLTCRQRVMNLPLPVLFLYGALFQVTCLRIVRMKLQEFGQGASRLGVLAPLKRPLPFGHQFSYSRQRGEPVQFRGDLRDSGASLPPYSCRA